MTRPRSTELCREPCSNTEPLSSQPLWPEPLRGRPLYHITPLHYLPSILNEGALYAKSVLAARGIAPRVTASRRDRMLGLADYVHFAFEMRTPILVDKLNKGYPHAVLVFDAVALADQPGHALLPFNTKAWRSRSTYMPVTDNLEKARLIHRHDTFRELRSLEFLVKYGVGLEALTSVAFATGQEKEAVSSLCATLSIALPAKMYVDETLAPPGYLAVTSEAMEEYFAACRNAGEVLKPPAIPFD